MVLLIEGHKPMPSLTVQRSLLAGLLRYQAPPPAQAVRQPLVDLKDLLRFGCVPPAIPVAFRKEFKVVQNVLGSNKAQPGELQEREPLRPCQRFGRQQEQRGYEAGQQPNTVSI